jgi:hypothetical protein
MFPDFQCAGAWLPCHYLLCPLRLGGPKWSGHALDWLILHLNSLPHKLSF